jgi:hypothetical protein
LELGIIDVNVCQVFGGSGAKSEKLLKVRRVKDWHIFVSLISILCQNRAAS